MEQGSCSLIWNTVFCNRRPPPLPRFSQKSVYGFSICCVLTYYDMKRVHLCKCCWNIRLTVLQPRVIVSQYARCPACNLPESSDSPLSSYIGCTLQTPYRTKPLASMCYMYSVESFFCEVSNCLRAGIHVVLRCVKWQRVGSLHHFTCTRTYTETQ